jgi:hypothetical protein
LNQTGGSLDWTMPELAGNEQELVVQVTDGENGQVFAENADNVPSVLAHYKLFRDLTKSTYAEMGFTGLYGDNNKWMVNTMRSMKALERGYSAWILHGALGA